MPWPPTATCSAGARQARASFRCSKGESTRTIGRRPNTDDLGLARAGIATCVDDLQRASDGMRGIEQGTDEIGSRLDSFSAAALRIEEMAGTIAAISARLATLAILACGSAASFSSSEPTMPVSAASSGRARTTAIEPPEGAVVGAPAGALPSAGELSPVKARIELLLELLGAP